MRIRPWAVVTMDSLGGNVPHPLKVSPCLDRRGGGHHLLRIRTGGLSWKWLADSFARQARSRAAVTELQNIATREDAHASGGPSCS
jgi:hypothetical protein